MEKHIVKIGSVELYDDEALKLYEEKKYIVTYTGIYQLYYSNAQKQVYGIKVISQRGIAKRGRFHAMDAQTINHILCRKILIEE